METAHGDHFDMTAVRLDRHDAYAIASTYTEYLQSGRRRRARAY